MCLLTSSRAQMKLSSKAPAKAMPAPAVCALLREKLVLPLTAHLGPLRRPKKNQAVSVVRISVRERVNSTPIGTAFGRQVDMRSSAEFFRP